MDKTSALNQLLEKSLAHAAFDGWNNAMLKTACLEAGIDESQYIRICPNGPIDLIAFWVQSADDAMENFANETDLSALKIRERIRELVLFRLKQYAEHREAVRKACVTLASPRNLMINLKLLNNTIDLIWRLAGDQSNDYNWYTKRLLLSGVYISTLMYWLNDESDGFSDTFAFLDRRIENVMVVGGAIGKKFKKSAS